jgi:AcrR family transcriptional regulator
VALVLEQGYEAVTIQDITDRADLGRGTFYLHFKDKEEAVWSAIEDGLRTDPEDTPPPIAAGSTPRTEIDIYRNLIRRVDANRDAYLLMLGGQGSAAMTSRAQLHLAEELQQNLSSLPPDNFLEIHMPQSILVQMKTGAVIQLVRWWLETPNKYSVDDMAGVLYIAFNRKLPPKNPL